MVPEHLLQHGPHDARQPPLLLLPALVPPSRYVRARGGLRPGARLPAEVRPLHLHLPGRTHARRDVVPLADDRSTRGERGTEPQTRLDEARGGDHITEGTEARRSRTTFSRQTRPGCTAVPTRHRPRHEGEGEAGREVVSWGGNTEADAQA